MSYKIDLHTHSDGSHDGGLTLSDYQRVLEAGWLDAVAITDHDSIGRALEIRDQLPKKLQNRIIIGEEITTRDGEIIGLYLTRSVAKNLLHHDAVKAIRQQGGLVYIPHPFETVRSGLSEAALFDIIDEVDIIETHNGRAIFQNRGRQAIEWVRHYEKAAASSSDAHGRRGWGRTYSVVGTLPTKETLVSLLNDASHSRRLVGSGALYPKVNRLKKKLRRV